MSEEKNDDVIERPSQIEVATREALQTLGYTVNEKDDRQWTWFTHPNLLNGAFWMGKGYPRFWSQVLLNDDEVTLDKKIEIVNENGRTCTCDVYSQKDSDGKDEWLLRITGLVPVDGSVAQSTSQINTWLTRANAIAWGIGSAIDEVQKATANQIASAKKQCDVPAKLVERSSWLPFSKN